MSLSCWSYNPYFQCFIEPFYELFHVNYVQLKENFLDLKNLLYFFLIIETEQKNVSGRLTVSELMALEKMLFQNPVRSL